MYSHYMAETRSNTPLINHEEASTATASKTAEGVDGASARAFWQYHAVVRALLVSAGALRVEALPPGASLYVSGPRRRPRASLCVACTTLCAWHADACPWPKRKEPARALVPPEALPAPQIPPFWGHDIVTSKTSTSLICVFQPECFAQARKKE